MSKKTKVSLSIDDDLLRLAKIKYPNLSGRVNQLLSIDLHAEDEESMLMKEIASLQDELKVKTEKLCSIRKQQYGNDTEGLDKLLLWAYDVYGRRGVLGLNVLERQCKKYKVSFVTAKNILEKNDVAFVKFDG